MFKLCKMHPTNGRVDIALKSEYSPGRDTVYWSPRGLHEGRGGFNSFVLVADSERGQWRTKDGEQVNLLSINGSGEVRWEVDPGSLHYGEGAHVHFDLIPWDDRREIYVLALDNGLYVLRAGHVLWFTQRWEAEKAAKEVDAALECVNVQQLAELKSRVDRGDA